MIKFIQKLESNFNKGFFALCRSMKNKSKKKKSAPKAKSVPLSHKFNSLKKKSKDKALHLFNDLKDSKTHLLALKAKFLTKDKTTSGEPKTKPEKAKQKNVKVKQNHPIILFFTTFSALLSAHIHRILRWFLSLTSEQIVVTTTITIVSVTSGLIIYKSGKDIYEKSTPTRKPASIATTFETRPEYYKADRKQYKMYQIRFPIYMKNRGNEVKYLSMDLTLHSDNRFVARFMDKNDYLVKDALISSLEPIVPSFPLKEEGKRIIKEKVQQEITNLLHKQGLEGEIITVTINDLIGA